MDKESLIGREYEKRKDKSVFYRDARFFSAREIMELLERNGFKIDGVVQTLFKKLDEIRDVEPVEEGYGRGSFVVIRAKKVV